MKLTDKLVYKFIFKRKNANGWLTYARICNKCGKVFVMETKRNKCFCGNKLVEKFIECDGYDV